MNSGYLMSVGLRFILVALFVLTPFQISYSKTISATARLDSTALKAQSYAIGQERRGMYLGASAAKTLVCVVGESPDPIRGYTMGCTFHDLQKYGSMGRQIATVGPDHIINFTFTNQRGNSATGGRNVQYNAEDPGTGVLCDAYCNLVDIAGDIIPPNRSGFTVLAPVSNGTIINAHQWDKNFGLLNSKFSTYTYQNQTPSLGDFVGGKVDSAALAFSPDMTFEGLIWPQIAVTEADSTPMITHLLLSGQANDNEGIPIGPNVVVYIRRVGSVWQPVDTFFLAENYFRSPVITASRQSQRVAMAFSGGRGDGSALGGPLLRNNGLPSGKNDNDIYLRISEDAGATWGPLTNITRRPNADPGGFAPHAKLSILFDEADVLHVVWQAISWPGYDGQFTTRSRMMHWDEANNVVRVAADANWDPTFCDGGENTLNLDNPQLSACDGKLYLSFTQFAPVPLGRSDDCAERAFGGSPGDGFGAANGDIYVSVSDDGGLNWDISRNLTNTYTPNCDTVPGGANPDCDSDVWHSATRYGIDVTDGDWEALTDLTVNIDGTYAGSDYLFVQYINDGDAGAAVRGEGAWTDNAVKAIRFGCVNAINAGILTSSISDIVTLDTLELGPGVKDTTLSWILQNIGALDITGLTISVVNDNPPGNLTVSGFGSQLLSGLQNADTGTITLNATKLLNVDASADIIVDGSFVGAPKTFSISYSVVTCCDTPGDANDDQAVNIADVTFLINRIFAGGVAPVCCEKADANGDGRVNISDVTFLIALIFASGADPICGPAKITCGI